MLVKINSISATDHHRFMQSRNFHYSLLGLLDLTIPLLCLKYSNFHTLGFSKRECSGVSDFIECFCNNLHQQFERQRPNIYQRAV